MSKKKINTRLIIITAAVIVSVIIVLVAVSGWLIINVIKTYHVNPLAEIEPDSQDVPNYVVDGVLHCDYGEIGMFRLCIDNGVDLYKVFCICNQSAYIAYGRRNGDNIKWALGVVDLQTQELQSLFEMSSNSVPFDWGIENGYRICNGYYYDGMIVMNNYEEVVTYNLKDQTVKRYFYDEYHFPEDDIEIIHYASYDESLYIYRGDERYAFELNEMAEGSETINKIYNLKKLRDERTNPNIYPFWTEQSVHIIEDKIYVVGDCSNNQGNSFAVILEYDCAANEWRYLGCANVVDIAYRGCYVIP